MIVTCQNCDTSFQLDEERVPKQGIRVRCSRCKEAFFLPHPSVSQSQAIDEVASEAARTATAPPPDATQDLSPSSQVSGSDATIPLAAGAVSERPAEEINNEDDAEWEFNRDPVQEVDPADAAASHGASTFGGSAGGDPSGLDLAGPPEPESAEQVTHDSIAIDESVAGESAFGSVDDFSSLMEEDVSAMSSSEAEAEAQVDAQVDSLTESDPAVENDEPIPKTTGSPSIESSASSDPSVGLYVGGAGIDELGEPESWDFFSDESLESSNIGGAAPDGRAALGSIDHTTSGAALGDASPLCNADERGDSVEDWEYGPEASPPSALSKLAVSAGRTLGWLMTTSLIVLGLVSGLWNTAESLVTSAQAIELDRFRAESIRAQWVDTVSAGKLLLVTGELRNLEAGAIQVGTVLQVALLGADGQRLTSPPAPAGIGLAEAQVRELSGDELWAAQNRAAFALTQKWIEPGGATRFQTLFPEVPADAVRFAVEFAPTSLDSIEHVVIPSEGETLPTNSQAAPANGIEAGDGAASKASADAGGSLSGDELTWGD